MLLQLKVFADVRKGTWDYLITVTVFQKCFFFKFCLTDRRLKCIINHYDVNKFQKDFSKTNSVTQS